jgi:hypothetical protein
MSNLVAATVLAAPVDELTGKIATWCAVKTTT